MSDSILNCDVCTKTIPASELYKHVQLHELQLSSLRHKLNAYRASQKRFNCCGRVFKRSQELERHKDRHTTIDRICPFCANRFTKLSTYVNHECKDGTLVERREHIRHVRQAEREKRKKHVSPPQESACMTAVASQLPNEGIQENLDVTTSGQPPDKPPVLYESPWQNNQSVRWNEMNFDGVILDQILQDLHQSG
ncbi:hypothetical protein FOCG_16333 [Fusarium oxysporum f. sp. radicis-lycopersici 26381]|uniref:C2H2-type domain-containing protein n=2 Tax=Fusarium oxysporum TaxID=5507 RepID=W9IRZ2_FUSOX|nr:hypothetical protein FOYG_02258 [Fusarium oxysporum NRRL 32931]EXA30783.1 hypothetical protein FOVG_17880 [Fusarium oxysporum f. sp. pisi HDV247]EXL41531.1 hypothetical protein FOCG_16333 [Fusarium oxysporum f. sp. radicis-lycopersici 26381]